MNISIGVFAYNEERTIAQTVQALRKQRCASAEILEILVVSSASTDRTEAIVEEIAREDPRLRLLREDTRRGKASAINTYLAARNPAAGICFLASADILPAPDAVEKIVAAFHSDRVGMAGGRPVPVNDANHFLGFVVQLQWELHHQISLRHPKCGEMVAFRANLTHRIPEESPVDEASLEAIARARHLELRYVPEAVFRNRGPETIAEFVQQRRRIAHGHRWLKRTAGYRVSTASPLLVLGALARTLKADPRQCLWTAGAIGLEAYCHLLGMLDGILKPKSHQAWKMIPSSKKAFAVQE